MEEQNITSVKYRNDKPFKRYLWDFMVVVCGIAITFTISGLVSSHKEKKALNSHLDAVKIELQDNLSYLKERLIYFEKAVAFTDYLLSKDKTEHNVDSIWAASIYKDNVSIIEEWYNLMVEKSAFETLKASGMMNQGAEQTLLRSLMKSYTMLDEVKQQTDDYQKRKVDMLMETIRTNRILMTEGVSILDPRMEDVYIFFATRFRLDWDLSRCIEQLEKTLAMFR